MFLMFPPLPKHNLSLCVHLSSYMINILLLPSESLWAKAGPQDDTFLVTFYLHYECIAGTPGLEKSGRLVAICDQNFFLATR